MKTFQVGELKFFVRESMPWRIYRDAQSKMAKEFGEIRAELNKEEMKSASLKFGLDIEQKVQDFYVPKLIKRIVKGDTEYTTVSEIVEVTNNLSADDFKPVFDYCVNVYERTVNNMTTAKKKK